MSHNDPALYRKLSEPFASSAEAIKAIELMERELRTIREEYKIPNFAVAFSLSYFNESGTEVEVSGSITCGDETKAEWMHRSSADACRERLMESLKKQAKP